MVVYKCGDFILFQVLYNLLFYFMIVHVGMLHNEVIILIYFIFYFYLMEDEEISSSPSLIKEATWGTKKKMKPTFNRKQKAKPKSSVREHFHEYEAGKGVNASIVMKIIFEIVTYMDRVVVNSFR